jgi:hypothetical protein
MKYIKVVILGLLFSTTLQAQLLNEIGFFVGGSNYSGDIGKETYIAPNRLAGSLVYKRNLNNRISLRSTFSYYDIAAADKNSNNEGRRLRNYNFSNPITELALGLEINYWDYDITSHHNTYTPYIVVEFAGMYYDTVSSEVNHELNYTNKISYAIPFGVGFKSKIANRISYAVEVRAQYTFEDDLDYNHPDISSLQFGNPTTNDWYFFSGVSLAYSFGRPPCAVPRKY